VNPVVGSNMRRALVLGATAMTVAAAAGRAGAQRLAPKPALATSGPTGCASYAATPAAPAATGPGDDAEARQLIADGQEAALQGEHAAARDAFSKAAMRAPSNARVAYYLGREYEALDSATAAVREYCRYLALAPNAPDGDEVRGRVVRLVPSSELARVDEARANFRSGVALLERRQFAAAEAVFGAVTTQLPAAGEAYYNRGLARAARGERAAAIEDFEKYLDLTPGAANRADIRTASVRLQDRVYSPGRAFVSGIVPGLGQMNTGRPLLGLAVLAAVAGAAYYGFLSTETIRVQQFTDPFGNSYSDSIPRTERPHFVAAAAGAGALWLGASIEAMAYARGTRARAESIIDTSPGQPSRTGSPARTSAVLARRDGGPVPIVLVTSGRRVGIGVSLSFGASEVQR
jgi:tetratricopeptide (TPR) repeat protein